MNTDWFPRSTYREVQALVQHAGLAIRVTSADVDKMLVTVIEHDERGEEMVLHNTLYGAGSWTAVYAGVAKSLEDWGYNGATEDEHLQHLEGEKAAYYAGERVEDGLNTLEEDEEADQL